MRAFFLILLLGVAALAVNEKPSDDVPKDVKEERILRIVLRDEDKYQNYRMAIHALEFFWVCSLLVVTLMASELLRRCLILTRQVNALVQRHIAERTQYYQAVATEDNTPMAQKESQWYQ